MQIISGLALAMLSLVGYSAGAVGVGAKRRVLPDLVDIVIVIAIWAASLATRGVWNRWLGLGLWTGIGLVTGAACTVVRLGHFPIEKVQPIRRAAHGWRGVWLRFTGFSQRMGNFQSRILLAIFYFSVVIPFGIGMRLFSSPLQNRRPTSGGSWIPRESDNPDMESARSQF